MQEVPVQAGVDKAEDVRALGRGPNLPRLRQGGPPGVGDPGGEGLHLGGHLQLACQGIGVGGGGGGWRTGSLFHTRPQQSAATAWGLPAAVSPSKRVRRRSERRCQQSRAVFPMHHPAVPGWPPQRRAGLLMPHRRQVPAPCVEEAGVVGLRPGGAHEEDPGIPPLQSLGDNGPLGRKLTAIGALDCAQLDKAVRTLVVGVPPPILGPGEEVLEGQDPRARPF